MEIKEIITKVRAGEELSEAEQTYLEDWQPPKLQANGIPQARFNEVLAQKKELDSKLAEITGRLEAKELEGLSELERLRKELEKSAAEKAAAEEAARIKDGEIASIKRAQKVASLASQSKFLDADYLGYEIDKSGVDLDDEQAVTAFMEKMKAEKAAFFIADVSNGGAGTRLDAAPGSEATKYAEAKSKGDLVGMIASAPEAK